VLELASWYLSNTMRNTDSFDVLSRRRWRKWLKATVGSVKAAALARALVDEDTPKDSQPRAMVNAWLDGERTVHCDLAWRTGEVLRKRGCAGACGLAALYAAGYYELFLGLIRGLAYKHRRGRELAAALYVYVPLAVDAKIEPAFAREIKRIASQPRFRSVPESAFARYVGDGEKAMAALSAADWKEIEGVAATLGLGSYRKSTRSSRLGHYRAVHAPQSLRAVDREYCMPALETLAAMQGRNPLRSWRLAVVSLNDWATDMAAATSLQGMYYHLLAALDKAISILASDSISAFG